MTLDEVIARLEAGESGIEADGRIWCALNGVKFLEAWETNHNRNVAFTRPPKRTREVRPARADLPHYTTSLDAALTLVPEGWRVLRMGMDRDGSWTAELRGPKARWAIESSVSLPLALCITALKARQP